MPKARRTSNRPVLQAPKGKLYISKRGKNGRAIRWTDSAGTEWTARHLQKVRNGGLSPEMAKRVPLEVRHAAHRYGVDLDYLANRWAFAHDASERSARSKESALWTDLSKFVRGYDLHSQRRRSLKERAKEKHQPKPPTPNHKIRLGKLTKGGAIQPELFGSVDRFVSDFDYDIDDIDSEGISLDLVLGDIDDILDDFGYDDWADYDDS